MKNFPDKPLAASTSSLYNLSIFMNILTVAGLALGLIAGFMSEVSHENTSADRTGLIILTLLALITIVNLILLICQLGIRKYLRKNSQATLKFMVDSIGSTRSEISFDP
jgi:uncharacterized membrane protein